MLWIKAFHVMFVVAWFAGLFYLPRLFVYHCEVTDEAGHERFCIMERRLYGITTLGMVGTWLFGLGTLALEPFYLHAGWLHAKLALVVLLSAYHGWLKVHLRKFAARQNTNSARYWRIANEVPALFLIAIVILAVVKPF
ncbi:MAG: protoporphyrinogen oxidase HemJ [Sinobacteraceae bacterium]|nr:protoporphyrinogen oxidase HemJ [Nevskiaceae bacterium]